VPFSVCLAYMLMCYYDCVTNLYHRGGIPFLSYACLPKIEDEEWSKRHNNSNVIIRNIFKTIVWFFSKHKKTFLYESCVKNGFYTSRIHAGFVHHLNSNIFSTYEAFYLINYNSYLSGSLLSRKRKDTFPPFSLETNSKNYLLSNFGTKFL
jgi:hypothetical protein